MLDTKPRQQPATGASTKRFAIVLNAGAGSALGDDPAASANKLAEALRTLSGARVEAEAASGADIVEAIERAAAGPAEIVIVAGGDGTVAAAAPILRKHGKVLGVIPLGTYNLLARDLEIPLDTEGAIAAAAAGVVREIDVATVNGRMFLCQSGFGFFTRLAYARQKLRQKSWFGRWVQPARAFFDAVRHLRKVDVIVRADDAKLRFRSVALLVTINSYHRNPAELLKRDRLDGGRFALYSIRYRTAAGLLRFGLKLLLRTWHRDEHLEIVSSRRLVVSSRRPGRPYRSRRLPLTADGELLSLETPIQYRLLSPGLKILAPAPVPPAAAAAVSEAPDAPHRAPL